MVDKVDHPASAPHEIRGNILYAQHNDSPYWAVRRLVQELDGGEDGIEIEIRPGDGEEWSVSVGYQKSGLEPQQ